MDFFVNTFLFPIRWLNIIKSDYDIFFVYNIIIFTWINLRNKVTIVHWNIFSITHTFHVSNVFIVLKLHKNSQSFCYITCYLLTRLWWQFEIGLRTPSLEQARCTFIPYSNVSEQRSLKTKGIRMVKKGLADPYRCHLALLFSYTFISDDKESLRAQGAFNEGANKTQFFLVAPPLIKSSSLCRELMTIFSSSVVEGNRK